MDNNPALYEVHTIQWLSELSSTYGRKVRLGNVPTEEWNRLRELGFRYVWLMGLWRRSAAAIRVFQRETEEYEKFREHVDSLLPGWSAKDLAGSPYSVADYSPDPEIGTWEDLKKAREELRQRGMGLVLDFVPNHTAPDHPWVTSNPDFYFHATEEEYRENPRGYTPHRRDGKTLYLARGRDPHFPPWSDTLQLNHFNPGLRAGLIEELKNIASHCDGIRCDMAMLVLNDVFAGTWGWAARDFEGGRTREEFWAAARSALPGTLLLAEAYWGTEGRLLNLGFDYVYDKVFYDLLREGRAASVLAHLRGEMGGSPRAVRFIENHDEPRSAAAFPREKLRAASVLHATLPGLRLYHHGQFEGRRVKTPIQLSRIPPEEPDEELSAFYEKLLRIVRETVFHEGRWQVRDVERADDDSCRNLIAYRWKDGNGMRLVVVNFGEGLAKGRVMLRPGDVDSHASYLLRDELQDAAYSREGGEMSSSGILVILECYEFHIFTLVRLVGRRGG